MQSWHVLQTKPHREKGVSLLLKQGGFESFFPQIKDMVYREGQPHFKLSPLFPSYIFVHANLEVATNFHLIKYTRGVNKILCAEKRPIPLSSDIVQTIKNRATDNGIIETYAGGLKVGDPIRVKKGVLKDLVGILEKPSSPDGRISVLLKLINYEMQAKLHWTEVERMKVA